MASSFPYEGLNYFLAQFTGGNPATAPVYVGLFTSQSATTVPSQDTKLTGATSAPYTTGTSPVVEVPSSTNYTRIAIPSSAWGAPTNSTNTQSIATQYKVTFPQATSSWGTINGFFLCNAFSSTGQNSGIVYYYANLPTAQTINVNNQLSFPVFIQFAG